MTGSDNRTVFRSPKMYKVIHKRHNSGCRLSETPTPQDIEALTHRFKFVKFFTEFNSSFRESRGLLQVLTVYRFVHAA
jgi:hypothetical protein